ncbi:hypothetical protein [Palleronia sp. LCG004]|nr:hypothetical protein [Palleronia sp. LCG004]WOI56361.1 hypothetical protein RVY76_00785 [Palleronia sp. LCG004]
MSARLGLFALLVLAACGAAGPPEPYQMPDRETGIAISGTAEIGITGGSF